MNESIEHTILKEEMDEAVLHEAELEVVEDVPSRMIGNSDYAEIVGDGVQIAAMMEDWAKYIGEVENPVKNTDNAYLKSTYAALDSVLNATRPVLSKYGLGITQYPAYKAGEGMKVTTLLTHRSGAYIVYPAMIIPLPNNADAQKIVAASTYARRATANAILGVHGESDDDGNSLAGKTSAPKKPKASQSTVDHALAEARTELTNLCKKRSTEVADKEEIYKVIVKYTGGNKNPNMISSIGDCKAAGDEIKKLK